MFRKIIGVKPQRFSKPLRFSSDFIYLNKYVAIAELMNAELWTADKRLYHGIKQVGIEWVHWIGEKDEL
jgi:hypothetical protein